VAGELILCARVQVENMGAITAEVKGGTQLVAHILRRAVRHDITSPCTKKRWSGGAGRACHRSMYLYEGVENCKRLNSWVELRVELNIKVQATDGSFHTEIWHYMSIKISHTHTHTHTCACTHLL